MFSLIAKTNKGRRYYYLREPRRIGDKVRPNDYYLGRMDAQVVPDIVIEVLHAQGMFSDTMEGLVDKARKDAQRPPAYPGARKPMFMEDYDRMRLDQRRFGWIRRRFNLQRKTVAVAAGWWKVIEKARLLISKRGKTPGTPKERRWIAKANEKVAKLEAAMEANKAKAKRKALAFYLK